MLDAFHFNHPDRIPVVYHPSPAGLHVHGQKLLDLFNRYPPDNPITFDALPAPNPGATDENGRYHEFRKDEWGTTWEHLIFGVHGHPKEYPFPSWEAARDYAFPPVPSTESPAFVEQRERVQKQKKDFLIFQGWISIFEKLHALRPMDDVLVDLLARDEHLLSFLDRLTEYWQRMIACYLALGADVIVFGDDWGTQTAQMVSTNLFRETFKPRYAQLMAQVRRGGAKCSSIPAAIWAKSSINCWTWA